MALTLVERAAAVAATKPTKVRRSRPGVLAIPFLPHFTSVMSGLPCGCAQYGAQVESEARNAAAWRVNDS